ncbi:MAG: hypothetical protein EHJ95_02885 [Methanobacteriota archaeon]|nr:MAG: hypothetical protein EHJ95_02885 [Euryarchaeota archaeon]
MGGNSEIYLYNLYIVVTGGNMPGDEMLKTTVGIFEKLLTADSIMGRPIEAEGKVIIPIAGIGFGFGGGEGRSATATGCAGAGSGGGGGVSPVAVVILHKDVRGRDGVQLMPLHKLSPIAEAVSETIPKVADAIPRIIDSIRTQGGSKMEGASGWKAEAGVTKESGPTQGT